MSTYMAKQNEVVRKWYILDATGKPLGRVATQAAHILRGKHKTIFTPHADCGDHVIIINSDKAILTGKKLEQKYHYWHTGWVGGIKSIQYKKLMKERSDKAMTLAVKGMVPDTVVGRKSLTRLRVYKADQHDHAAQKPELYSR